MKTTKFFTRLNPYLPLLMVMVFVFISCLQANAQCAMCQGTVESTRAAGASTAEGVNKGVLYIFMMPYLIIATLAYFWWRGKKKAETEN